MVEYGYAMSSEEHAPNDLVRYAIRAEELGFSFALISDHFHPWVDKQGNAPFVWNIIGAIAYNTRKLRLGTGVTCPTVRIHPGILAQAAATSAAMMPGRFFFGVGTGENLNEHIFGDHWPPIDLRQEMFTEALDIIRRLWEGEEISYWGDFYTVENARLYTLPPEPPPLYVAASGPSSAELAGQIGDGFISTSPEAELVKAFNEAGGKGKPCYGKTIFCYAKTEAEALDTVAEWWPTSAVPGSLHADLPTPAHFEDAAKMVKKEDMAGLMPMGPDPRPYLEEFQKFLDAGFTHIYLHQVGPDQDGFFSFYEKELKPHLPGL